MASCTPGRRPNRVDVSALDLQTSLSECGSGYPKLKVAAGILLFFSPVSSQDPVESWSAVSKVGLINSRAHLHLWRMELRVWLSKCGGCLADVKRGQTCEVVFVRLCGSKQQTSYFITHLPLIPRWSESGANQCVSQSTALIGGVQLPGKTNKQQTTWAWIIPAAGTHWWLCPNVLHHRNMLHPPPIMFHSKEREQRPQQLWVALFVRWHYGEVPWMVRRFSPTSMKFIIVFLHVWTSGDNNNSTKPERRRDRAVTFPFCVGEL